MHGFVYVLGNEAFPDLLKVGQTTKAPDQRAIELSHASGVPQPFEVLAFWSCNRPQWAETFIHRELAKHRCNDRREFFRCELTDLYALNELYDLHITSVGCTQLLKEIVRRAASGLPATEAHRDFIQSLRSGDLLPEEYLLNAEGFDLHAYLYGKPKLKAVQ